MNLTYEKNGLAANRNDGDGASRMFSERLTALLGKGDARPGETSGERAQTLAALSDFTDTVVDRIQASLAEEGVPFSVEHYASYYSTIAFTLSRQVPLVEWEDCMMAFLLKCDERGVTHRSVAIQSFMSRQLRNDLLMTNKPFDKDTVAFLLLSCELDLSASRRLSDKLLLRFTKFSEQILGFRR